MLDEEGDLQYNTNISIMLISALNVRQEVYMHAVSFIITRVPYIHLSH